MWRARRTGGGNPDWLQSKLRRSSRLLLLNSAAAAGASAYRQDGDRRTCFQSRRRQRPLRPADQSDLPGSSARRFIERIGCRGRGRPDRFCAGHRYRRLGARAGQFLRVCSVSARATERCRSMASCRSRRPTTPSDGSRATPRCFPASAACFCPTLRPSRSIAFGWYVMPSRSLIPASLRRCVVHARHSISMRYPCSKDRSSNGSNAIACCRERRSGPSLAHGSVRRNRASETRSRRGSLMPHRSHRQT